MLKRVDIHSFQCHETLTLYPKKITLLTGSSDRGKSAILRAISWCLFNNITGEAFVKDGHKSAQVTIHTDHGEIVRSRGAGMNSYRVCGQDLKAFGTSMPEPVQETHRLDPDLCFQGQHDGAFLLSKRQGEATSFLNGLVDLERMHAVQKRLESNRRKLMSTLNEEEKQRESCQERISELGPVREALAALSKVQETEDRLTELRHTRDNLQQCLLDLRDRDRLDVFDKAVQLVERILATVETFRATIAQARRVDAIVMESCRGDELSAYDRAMSFVDTILFRVQEYRTKKTELGTLHVATMNADALRKKFAEARLELSACIEDGKERFKGKCPTCGKSGFNPETV